MKDDISIDFYAVKSKVERTIRKNNLITPRGHLYVAVSGGADSMALLKFLCSHYDKADITAVHVNHGIRGDSADRDMYHVMNYCSKNKIHLIVFNAQEDGTVIPDNPSEEWARELRYKYFDSLIQRDTDKLVTAHTLSDQVETVLFRLARGSHLRGIPVKRGYIIRPFLNITREEVEVMIDFYGLEYVTDETNLLDTYSRNKIRLNVVPVLREVNSKAVENIGEFASKFESAFAVIQQLASDNLRKAEVVPLYKYRTRDFYSLLGGKFEIVLDSMIETMVGVYTSNQASKEMVTLIKHDIKQGCLDSEEHKACRDRITQVSDFVRVSINCNFITFICKHRLNRGKITPKLGDNNLGYLPISSVYASTVTSYDKKRPQDVACCSKLQLSDCYFQLAQPGDVFKPFLSNEKRLVKLLHHIPSVERSMVPVLKDANGNIIWVKGIGFTAGYQPDESTDKKFLGFRLV